MFETMVLDNTFFEISAKVATLQLIFAGEHAGAIGFDRGGRELCAAGVMTR